MSVISIRLPDDAVAFLKQEGVTPGTLAKELVLQEVQRLRVQAARRRLDAVSRPPSRPLVDLLREERNAH